MSKPSADIQRIPKPPSNAAEHIDQLFGGLTVTVEQAEQFTSPEWLFENLIISGHIVVIPAEPNGGKTTLLWWVSKQLRKRGVRVVYINADIAATDAKQTIAEAREHGITLVLPEIADTRDEAERLDGMKLAIKRMQDLIATGVSLDRVLFVIDTLKKAASPNEKKEIATLMRIARQVSGRGGTVVLLAHTLKYYDNDGLPVFEGVGDIRADCDDLIYLIPAERPEGGKLISTRPDKRRGDFQPITFILTEGREVIPCAEYVDLRKQKKLEQSREEDQADIDEVLLLIASGPKNQSDIHRALGGSRRQIRKLLRMYDGIEWESEVGFQHNERRYRLRLPND